MELGSYLLYGSIDPTKIYSFGRNEIAQCSYLNTFDYKNIYINRGNSRILVNHKTFCVELMGSSYEQESFSTTKGKAVPVLASLSQTPKPSSSLQYYYADNAKGGGSASTASVSLFEADPYRPVDETIDARAAKYISGVRNRFRHESG